jgi:hypothetical protein
MTQDQQVLDGVRDSDFESEVQPAERNSYVVDHSHLITRPLSAPRDGLSVGEIVALLPTLPDWRPQTVWSARRARLNEPRQSGDRTG